MMKNVFLMFVVVVSMTVSYPADAQVPDSQTMSFLMDMNREIEALLDAYLEAIPECPVHPDTPVRLWVLDLAWLRADAVISEAVTLNTASLFSESTIKAWTEYLLSSKEYLNVFLEIQQVYHDADVPDSALCIELENKLLNIDSIWNIDETNLFKSFVEEEVQ